MFLAQKLSSSQITVVPVLLPAARRMSVFSARTREGKGRGIIPQERRHYKSALENFKAPFAIQRSCGLKSALRSLAQRPRKTHTCRRSLTMNVFAALLYTNDTELLNLGILTGSHF